MNACRIFSVAFVLLPLGIATFASRAPADTTNYAYETALSGYYLGSGRAIAVDADGNAYIAAAWYLDHVNLDILIAKLDPDGVVQWALPITGDRHDYATDILADGSGQVYVTGWTDSDDFPIVNGLEGTLTGFRDAFVMKLSAASGAILYSTYLGGDYTDEGQGIALTDAGEIIIVGSTKSTDFPTLNAYQAAPSAPLHVYKDAFITKISEAGDAILYSTYFGGYKNDTAEHVALDAGGDIVISGETDAVDFPLVDPVQSAPHDIFVARFSPDGSRLEFSTYFGGGDLDRLGGMAMDTDGNVILVGSTRSADFPTTPGAYQQQFVGAIDGCGSPPFEPLHNCEDVFVARLATNGAGLLYGTYIGGSSVDECHDVALDTAGRSVVVGYTTSADFPGADGILGSIFVTELDRLGGQLVFSAVKPSGSPGGHGIATGPQGNVFFTGAVHTPADIYVAELLTDVNPATDVPALSSTGARNLLSGSPNPFTGATRLVYTLPAAAASSGRLDIYDAAGRRVRSMGQNLSGTNERVVFWDGSDGHGRPLPSGVYFARLEWSGGSETMRMVLAR